LLGFNFVDAQTQTGVVWEKRHNTKKLLVVQERLRWASPSTVFLPSTNITIDGMDAGNHTPQ
jgi:hypothetical protein